MHKTGLPSSWAYTRLDAVAEIRTGLALGKKDLNDPVRRPYLRVANVQDGHLALDKVKHVHVSAAEVERYSLTAGDILMTEGGDFDKLGRGTMWRGEIDGCLHQNHVFVVRTDHGRLLPEYLEWLTSSPYGRRYFKSCSKQSTNLASINSSQVRAFPVPLPTIGEQLSIARFLRAWDAAVRQAGRLLKLKCRLKRGLVQQLLTGRRRFATFNVQPIDERGIPSDWGLVPLTDVARKLTRKNRAAVQHVLTISGKRGFVDQRDYFDRRIAAESVAGYIHIKRGEFAYNRSLMNGYPFGAIKRLDEVDEGVVSTLYICFALTGKRMDSDYMAHLFEAGYLNAQLCRITNLGSRAHGLLNVTATDFMKLHVPVPPLAEQQKIAAVLNVADREIDLLEQQLAALREQKKGLMQKLLTGQIRVKVEDGAHSEDGR